MKTTLPAIALGVSLACACQFAAAGPSVTVTQQGSGNTAAAEQTSADSFDSMVARITQTGNNNHVGGPGGTTAGIIQRGPAGGAQSIVTQNGTSNNAGIVQGPVFNFSATAIITQTGSGNSGTIRQQDVQGPVVSIEQNGAYNIANIEQIASIDISIATRQTGNNNSVTVSQRNGGTFAGPVVVQNGDGNTASVSADGVGESGPVILQDGFANSARTNQTNGLQSPILIRQAGANNQADVTQSGNGHDARIDQNGTGNLASITQASLPGSLTGNSAVITQVGNINSATVRQVGQGYVANVSQIGSGNYTNIYQH